MSNADDFDFDHWHENYKKKEQEKREAGISGLRNLAPQLKELGVTEVHAEYNGSGDSGDFEAVYATPNDNDIEQVLNPLGLTLDGFKDMLWPLLPAGWEINEGSYGELVLDTATGKINRVHNERIEEVETTEDEL
jgi:hypothetical protein